MRSTNFFLVRPSGILDSSTQLLSSLSSLVRYSFLNLAFSALSAISFRPAENLAMSTNLGKGVTLPFSSWNR